MRGIRSTTNLVLTFRFNFKLKFGTVQGEDSTIKYSKY